MMATGMAIIVVGMGMDSVSYRLFLLGLTLLLNIVKQPNNHH
jgi:hypothetical protein